MPGQRPFDAVLVIAFGGPGGPDDVRPFLANVLRGRRVPPHRIEEVAANYLLFGGVSPLTAVTGRQAAGLQDRLAKAGLDLPVYVGMRNWHPLLADTLGRMADQGVRRAIGFIAAAHHSYSSCTQYRENVREARLELVRSGRPDIEVSYVPSWFDHPLFIETVAKKVKAAIERLPAPLRSQARIIFTAHSLPRSLAGACRYEQQLRISAEAVATHLEPASGWTLVYQSRSGMPGDPWLEPDIRDYLRQHRGELRAAVIVPIGFLCDHLEVLFDLDTQAMQLCREMGIPAVRAETTGDDPTFIDMMADVVRKTYERFRVYPFLPIVRGPEA